MQIDAQTLADHVAMFLTAEQLQQLIDRMHAANADPVCNDGTLLAVLVHMEQAVVNTGNTPDGY